MSKASHRALRGIAILMGTLILIWLPYEDNGPFLPLGMGIMIAVILAYWFIIQFDVKVGFRKSISLSLLVAITPIFASSLLMIFKSGLHNHGFPDFPLSDLIFILNFLPLSILSGLVFGAVYQLLGKKNELKS